MPFLNLPAVPAPHAELPEYLAQHPDTPMADLLEPYRKYEAKLREIYAQEPGHPALVNPHVNVLPLFNESTPKIQVRARDPETESEDEQSKYIMPLPKENRRPTGTLAVVPSIQVFQSYFFIFSESALGEVNWDNIVAAGSSVVNCLLPVPEKYTASRRSLRGFFHEKFAPASDVDLFLYGLSEDQAIEKIKHIENAVRDSILSETTTVRTKHAITICSEYPTRHVQIVLRIYKSVSEILTGFDIDSSCAAYDGKQVYCTPRALQSYITQINHVDLTRRSPSYENRLSKYSHRNFEIYWPQLDRSRIDPTIFERSFRHTVGLARLLVLEGLPTPTAQLEYARKRRWERGRPAHVFTTAVTGLHGNLKDEHTDEVAEWISQNDISNYDTFVVPYGRRFTAKRIEKLCYTRDLLLNAEWNQGNQKKTREAYLHRHPAFFGRAEDAMGDCCGSCPEPVTEKEIEMAQEDSKIYISGKVSFLTDNPGRQQIGSFNPVNDDDWTAMAYVGDTARLCQAIVDGDLDFVKSWITQDGVDPNRRDHTGRTPLHLAVICSTPEIVKELVNHGARLVARLADGRTALHLAAQRGCVEIVKTLMNKSSANEAEESEKEGQRRRAKQQAVQDHKVQPAPERKTTDQSSQGAETDESDNDECKESEAELVDATSEHGAFSTTSGSFVQIVSNNKYDEALRSEDVVLQDNSKEPDFYNVNVTAWDQPCSALQFAVINGHDEVVEILCQEYGADVLLPVKPINCDAVLTLTLCLHLPLEIAQSMVSTLISLGSKCSQADLLGVTAFHRFAASSRVDLLGVLADIDKIGTAAAINHVSSRVMYKTTSPLLSAISAGDIDMVRKLLDTGATPQISFETWLKSSKMHTASARFLSDFKTNEDSFKRNVEQPLIVALQSPHPEIALELLDHGTDPDTKTQNYHERPLFGERHDNALAIVQSYLSTLRAYDSEERNNTMPLNDTDNSDAFVASLDKSSWMFMMASRDVQTKKAAFRKKLEELKERAASDGLQEKNAAIAGMIKTLEKIRDKILDSTCEQQLVRSEKVWQAAHPSDEVGNVYEFVPNFKGVTDVTESRRIGYMQLFEAAWRGDLEKIKELTLTAWGEEKDQPPLSIAAKDDEDNNLFSLAFLRGHRKVAYAILEIAQAQYAPEEKRAVRFEMRDTDMDSNADSEAQSCSVCGSVHEDDDGLYRTIADDEQFTIDIIGEVSMQVKGRAKPIDILGWKAPAHNASTEDAAQCVPGLESMFRIVADQNDMSGLKFLLDTAAYYSRHDPESRASDGSCGNRCYILPSSEFSSLIAAGRTEMLAEVIRRTGAGLPLEEMIEKSGVAVKLKPRYYQGLTVYGKKRTDWAEAGRGTAKASTGLNDSPLSLAVRAGSLESTEWFLSDAPLRCYLQFSKSKAAEADERIAHLGQSPGGFEGAISRWLNHGREELIITAIEGAGKDENAPLVEYLIKAVPESLNARNSVNHTPLMLAALLGQIKTLSVVVKNGADQSKRHEPTYANLLHAILFNGPSAKELKYVLDLLDPECLARMFCERAHHASWCEGQTPLHSWLTYLQEPRYFRSYKTLDEKAAVLSLLLKYSGGRELSKIDSSGETPLHMVARLGPHPIVTRAFIEAIPADLLAALLRRENAAGQTPIEVAHSRFVDGLLVGQREQYTHFSVLSVDKWPRTDARQFIESASEMGHAKAPVQTRIHTRTPQTLLLAEAVWTTLSEHAGKAPGKRRLVSVNEANDVVRRISRWSKGRYSTKVVEPAGREDAGYDGAPTAGSEKEDLMTASFVQYFTKSYEKAWSYNVDWLDV